MHSFVGTHSTVYRKQAGCGACRRTEWHQLFLDVRGLHSTLPPSEEFCLHSKPSATIYAYSAPLLDGRMASLDEFRGQVLLIVNTASECGFTPQYEGLEALYRLYKDRGFTVLGFPCNQFGGQEPGSEAEIGAFCRSRFGVSFPLFAKVDVNGPGAHPLFQFLRRQKPGLFGLIGRDAIRWNFTKFLIDAEGVVAARYGSSMPPRRLAPAIERLLAGG